MRSPLGHDRHEPPEPEQRPIVGVPAAPRTGLSPTDSVSWGMRVAAAWAIRFLLVVGALYVLVLLLNLVSLVTVTVVVAIMITALLQPAVAALTRLGVPRLISAVLVFVLGVSAIVVAGWFVTTRVTGSWSVVSSQLQDSAVTIRHWLVNGPLHLSDAQVDKYTTELGDTIEGSRGTLTAGVFATATSAIGVLSGAVFCLFATLFLLLDDGAIWGWIVGLFPVYARNRAIDAGQSAWHTLTAYMRGSVLLALVNAGSMVVVMMIAGLPLVVPLGLLIFLGSLVPIIGMLVAGAVVFLIALVTSSLTVAIVMAIALFLIVQLEGNLLGPWVLGRAVNIHPLAVLVSVTAGALLGGVFGAFIAVPLVAVVNNMARTLQRRAPRVPPLGVAERE